MLRGYRLYIAALGLALVSANHANAESRKQQPNAEQSVAKSLGDIASFNNQQSERAKRSDQDEAPCGQGKYGSSADLCAQWKAADAASDSAWWAWAGGIIGLGSLVGVFVAIGLAFHSNWIARDTAKRQLRAYIAVESCTLQPTNEGGFVLTAVLKNSGQTPAYNLRIMGESFAEGYPLAKDRPFLPVIEGHGMPLNAGGEVHCAKRILTTSFEETYKLVLAGKHGLYIQGICNYTDAFGEERETKFRYVFAGQPATLGMVMHAAETGNTAT